MMTQASIGRRMLLAGGAGTLLAAPAIANAQGGGGVALVIGNSKYQWEASLPNVKRDAPDVAGRLQEFGLKVDLVQDAGRDAMRQAVKEPEVIALLAKVGVESIGGGAAEFRRLLDVGVIGTFLFTQHTAKSMIRHRRQGSIVQQIMSGSALPSVKAKRRLLRLARKVVEREHCRALATANDGQHCR